MNERIRQLVEQANAQYCDLGDASCFKRLGLVEAVVFTPEDLEKFAQLIVAEVITIVEDQKNYNSTIYTSHDRDQAKGIVMELVKSIKQQLG